MKQLERMILHIGTKNVPFVTPEYIFKELKELGDFILKFLPDVEIEFFNTSNKNNQIKRT